MPVSKQKLSASTDGKAIKVAATSIASGTQIHTAVTGTTSWDEVWLYAVNSSSSDVKLTIGWGGTSDPDDTIEYTVPKEDGLKCIVPGNILQNSKIIYASAATANVIMIHGFVNRIS